MKTYALGETYTETILSMEALIRYPQSAIRTFALRHKGPQLSSPLR